MKQKPTGFIAICQCGEIVGAIDYQRADRKEAGLLLGKWLHHGCKIEPQFKGTWNVKVTSCICETINKNQHHGKDI